MLRTLFFRLHVGGYWAADGSYHGENMSKFSYFPSGEVGQNRKDLCGDSDVAEMITCTHELESKNLYVVRAADHYLDDVLIGEREEEEEPERQEFVSKEKCKDTIEKYAIREKSARQIMKHIISDEYAEQFTRMYDYVEELRKTNPACRRVIHLGGTFLKGRMKGQLLTAVGRDPNDAMYIIAWAIVPVENKVYWQWFMKLLGEDLRLELEHRMCARHIFANLQKRYKQMGPLHKVFWKCARAYNETVFWKQLEKMKTIKFEAYDEVKRSVGSNWSRAFFSDITKSAAVENNISESYNVVLKDTREKPVVALLEDIRRHIMASNLVKIKEMQNVTGLITPKAIAIMEKRKKSLKWCYPFSNGRGIYEVDHGKNKYVVHVRDKTSCTCREYDVSGIPCCHIISAMWAEYKETKLPETAILDWYSVEKWKLCYNSLLFPVNGMELWETHSDVVVMPPPDRIMPGRPKKK
ncbi:unnamed protein product [Arabidopsis thaliana]|uniref:(thale cress) hypothetical protein n=1 Tax=Arabidopsis thaliana TaxID=3702 RepID=A0A7G2DWJ9_ARATH|nr:unnamed protein product [Arabidopsis thaliana]